MWVLLEEDNGIVANGIVAYGVVQYSANIVCDFRNYNRNIYIWSDNFVWTRLHSLIILWWVLLSIELLKWCLHSM